MTAAVQVGQGLPWLAAGQKVSQGIPKYSTGWEGPNYIEGGASKLAHMTSVPTIEAAVAVLTCEDKEAFDKLATNILNVDEDLLLKMRREMHGEIHHPSKTFPSERSTPCADWTIQPYLAMWLTRQLMLRAWVLPDMLT
jgi:hypothetical protein